MIDFTLYTANCCGDSSNCVYPNKAHITDSAPFVAAIKQNHVCVAYKNNYRSNDNFLETDALSMDCDNDHSDDPKDWVYPLDVVMAFPDVSLLVSYSRNNMKVKNGKAARPKFHVYFPIPTMTDGKAYAGTEGNASRSSSRILMRMPWVRLVSYTAPIHRTLKYMTGQAMWMTLLTAMSSQTLMPARKKSAKAAETAL